MIPLNFRIYTKVCKRCNKIFKTSGKFSKCCDQCKRPITHTKNNKLTFGDCNCYECSKKIEGLESYYYCGYCKNDLCYDCFHKHMCDKMPKRRRKKMMERK
jgi:predicted amidophosphoribosyltransferase